MRKTSLLALVGLVLAGGAACNRKPQSGPEAALERAYKAGVLSKDEYEAKMTSLRAIPAPAPTPAAAALVTVAPAVVPSAPPAAPPPVEPPPVVAAPKKAPARASSARISQPKPTTAPTIADETPAPPPVPSAPPTTAPVPVVEPAAVDRDEDTPAPTTACAETEVRPGKEKGKQERFYPMPVAKVREAALKSLKDLEFNVRRASDMELEASKKRHIGLLIGSGGEKMTLQFEEAVQGGQRGTRVTGETKKNFVMRAGQKSWTNAVLDQTACTLHSSARGSGRPDNQSAIR